MLSADELWTLLYDEYLPFSLYADYKNGVSFEHLSQRVGLPIEWVEERVLAAESCINSGRKLALPAFDRRSNDLGRCEDDRRLRHRDAA